MVELIPGMPDPGDIVRCNYDFWKEREYYRHKRLTFPNQGDYLVVKGVTKDLISEKYMLFFEFPSLSYGLNSKYFDLVQREVDGDEVLNETIKIANKL